uniref:Uncharacterized protein n=1 Tax=Euplotes harpa TaxID=151035 RepID=A0A7S3N5J9_9SPIT|mmetsp:Transcript_13702/g.15899  ORF Transcript_13702/g.15899 Transcript_13702/m.15899 type:complete len:202 (+) Transcript_13702:854-1459(+)
MAFCSLRRVKETGCAEKLCELYKKADAKVAANMELIPEDPNQAEREEQQRKNIELTHQNTMKAVKIGQLLKVVRQQDEENKKLDKDVVQRDEKIEKLQAELARRDEQLKVSQEKLANAEKELKEKSDDSLYQDNVKLRKEIKMLKEKNSEYLSQIKSLNEQIKSLNKELESINKKIEQKEFMHNEEIKQIKKNHEIFKNEN